MGLLLKPQRGNYKNLIIGHESIYDFYSKHSSTGIIGKYEEKIGYAY